MSILYFYPRITILATLLFCFTLVIPKNIFSQNIVNVNKVTGTANVTIPICNIAIGDISSAVALNYNASGLKVEDYDCRIGLGWRLVANASITREVKGFPDDVEYQSDASYAIIKGWIRPTNTASQTIQGMTIANDNNPGTCGDEITDATSIANNFSYAYDTEPDYFYINAPGLSCSFIFDASASHTIKTIPYKDYKITYSADTYGRITAFTVVNENGIKYYFDRANFVEHSVNIFNPGTTVEINASTLDVFKRDFLMYRQKSNVAGYPLGFPVKYNDEWALTKIEDTRGNKISYNYENYTLANPEINKRYSYKPIEILKPNGGGTFVKKLLYGISTIRIPSRLLSITTYSLGYEGGAFSTAVQFNWGTDPGAGAYDEAKLLSIDIPTENKIFQLLYNLLAPVFRRITYV